MKTSEVDPLKAFRTEQSKLKNPDRKVQLEETHDADARKVRDLARSGKFHSLVLLAEAAAGTMSDLETKHKLQELASEFRDATEFYNREMLADPNRPIMWCGSQDGVLLRQPHPDDPPHKTRLAKAWVALLDGMNRTAKVGLRKRHHSLPIELSADVDAGREDKILIGWEAFD